MGWAEGAAVTRQGQVVNPDGRIHARPMAWTMRLLGLHLSNCSSLPIQEP
jgi:hypothetical protein